MLHYQRIHTRVCFLFPFLNAVRFADLSKEERKAVVKTVNKRGVDGSDDHTFICGNEIGEMLNCFEANNWDTTPCQPQINLMYDCVDARKNEPDPKMLSKRWQASLKSQVFGHFAKKKLLGRR
jgi:hypothetical protein